MSQPGKIASQPEKIASHPEKVASQPGKVASQPGKVASQPGKNVIQSGKVASLLGAESQRFCLDPCLTVDSLIQFESARPMRWRGSV